MGSARHASARRRLWAPLLAGALLLLLAATADATTVLAAARAGRGALRGFAGPRTRRPADPLARERFYVDPGDAASLAVDSLRAEGDDADAGALEAIANQPQAIWLTSDGSAATVRGVVAAAAAARRVPIFVIYNLPGRDCGSYSAGGAAGEGDYSAFIDRVVSGLGQHRAVVIVEPDALSETCMPPGTDALIRVAIARLDTDARAAIYVDAGNPGWQAPAAEAQGLAAVVGSARAGFAVNVSNFYPVSADLAYGTAISELLGGRHFVIDTSRDGGDVTPGQWCNPTGAALGAPPTTRTGSPLVDAELWIKQPGESDGTCDGGPPAGQFWLSGALALVGR